MTDLRDLRVVIRERRIVGGEEERGEGLGRHVNVTQDWKSCLTQQRRNTAPRQHRALKW